MVAIHRLFKTKKIKVIQISQLFTGMTMSDAQSSLQQLSECGDTQAPSTIKQANYHTVAEYIYNDAFSKGFVFLLVCYLCAATSIAEEKEDNAASWKRGANNPRKSAPTLLKDNPKYMHCPSNESDLFPTPLLRSSRNVDKNADI